VPTFMGKSEKVAALTQRVLLRIQRLIDEDSTVTVDGAEDVGPPSFGPRDVISGVKVVELNPELEVFLDDVIHTYRRLKNDPTLLRELSKQCCGVALYRRFGEIRHLSAHLSSFVFIFILIYIDTASA